MELYQKAAFYLKTTVPNPEETESVTWQCALCNEKSLQGSIRWVIKIRCGATVTFRDLPLQSGEVPVLREHRGCAGSRL